MDRVASGQRLGRRDAQEDAVTVLPLTPEDPTSELLLMLADGMGGHAGGDVASQLAIAEFGTHFTEVSENMRPRGRLREALDAANEALRQEIAANATLKGMGCTFIGALVSQGRLVWVSVGDSALFLLRNGALTKLNADHSLYGDLLEQVGRGEITQAEADAHPQRNALRSALAGNAIPMVDTNAITLEPGDVIVVASDGLDTLDRDEIAQIVQDRYRTGASAVERALLDAVEARERPRQDNTSVIVLREAGAPTSSGLGLPAWDTRADGSRYFPWIIGAAGAAGVLVLALLAYALFFASEVPELAPADLPPAAEAPGPVAPAVPPVSTPIEGDEPALPEEEEALGAPNGDVPADGLSEPGTIAETPPAGTITLPSDASEAPADPNGAPPVENGEGG